MRKCVCVQNFDQSLASVKVCDFGQFSQKFSEISNFLPKNHKMDLDFMCEVVNGCLCVDFVVELQIFSIILTKNCSRVINDTSLASPRAYKPDKILEWMKNC